MANELIAKPPGGVFGVPKGYRTITFNTIMPAIMTTAVYLQQYVDPRSREGIALGAFMIFANLLWGGGNVILRTGTTTPPGKRN